MKKTKVKKNVLNVLEERVRSLLRQCGFKVLDEEEKIPLTGGKKHRTVEISAKFGQDDCLKILVECKGGKQKNLKISSLVHDYQALQKKASADKIVFVIPDREIKDEDREYIVKKGMILWDSKKLGYYESLADAIGPYARYEIVHSLGLKTKEQSMVHNATALKILQPTTSASKQNRYEIFLFSITPEKLLKTSVVFRKASEENKDAFQRILKKKRLMDIGKYVNRIDTSLPTDIVISLPDEVEIKELKLFDPHPHLSDENDVKLVRLSIPLKYGSLEIIDGQHRLFGFVYAEEQVKRKFNLLLTALRDPGASRKKQLFIDINEKAKKLDPNLLTYLSYIENEVKCQSDSKLMAIKIVVGLNKIRSSPFKGRIRYLDIGGEIITLKGFSGYDLKSLVSESGVLRKFVHKNKSDEYIEILSAYFSTVKSLFPKEWKDPRGYIIFTNRGITAFLKLLKSLLECIDFKVPTDLISFRKYKTDFMNEVRKYLNPLKGFNFKTEHLKGQYIGAAGWSKFYKDLEEVIRREFDQFGIKLNK